MKTLSYYLGYESEIKRRKHYYFGQLWDGNGDGKELLDSESIAIYKEKSDIFIVVAFKVIIERNNDIMKSLVEITDIY